MENTFISIRWIQHFKAYLAVLPLYSLNRLSPSEGKFSDLAKFVSTTQLLEDVYKFDYPLVSFKNEKHEYARKLATILNRDAHAFSDAQVESIIRFIAFLDTHPLIKLNNLCIVEDKYYDRG